MKIRIEGDTICDQKPIVREFEISEQVADSDFELNTVCGHLIWKCGVSHMWNVDKPSGRRMIRDAHVNVIT